MYKSDIHVICRLCSELWRVNSSQAVSWPSNCNNMILPGRVIIKLPWLPSATSGRVQWASKCLWFCIQHQGVFSNKGTISLHWLLIPFFLSFFFLTDCFALCATCFEKSVLCLWFYFSMTNRRLLSQLQDLFFLKYLRKLCAVAYAILWHTTAYWSQNKMVSEKRYLLKTLLWN